MSLLPAQLPDLAGQSGVLLVEVLARLRSSCVRLILVAIGNVRLEDLPPGVIQLRPFFSAERGAALRDVPVCDQRAFQLLGVAPYDRAQEVEDALLDNGVIAREVLHGHAGLLGRERIEKHGGSERRIRSGLLVDNGEERGEAVGGVLLHAGQRKCELVDEGVAKLVAEDELVGPDVQRVGSEVLPARKILKMKRENPPIEFVPASHAVRSRTASQGSQRRAAALARSFLAQSARNSFISALSPRMRGATPLYFFVVPVIVRLTAP